MTELTIDDIINILGDGSGVKVTVEVNIDSPKSYNSMIDYLKTYLDWADKTSYKIFNILENIDFQEKDGVTLQGPDPACSSQQYFAPEIVGINNFKTIVPIIGSTSGSYYEIEAFEGTLNADEKFAISREKLQSLEAMRELGWNA